MPGLKLYIGIWAGLVIATIVEVLIRTTTAAIAGIVLVLILIASAKAISIALYYQHLRYERWELSVLPIAAIVAVTALAIATAYTIAMGNAGL